MSGFAGGTGGGAYDKQWKDLQKNALQFSSLSEAEQYHLNVNFDADKWYNQLSSEERRGIYDYTDFYYTHMNNLLRQSEYSGGNARIDNATSALNQYSVQDSVVVYRGMTGGVSSLSAWTGLSEKQLSKSSVQNALIGKTITEKGFTSTGISQEAGWDGINLTIYVPKGTHGTYVDPISANRGEKEFLIQRGTKYVIREVRTNSNKEITGLTLQAVNN